MTTPDRYNLRTRKSRLEQELSNKRERSISKERSTPSIRGTRGRPLSRSLSVPRTATASSSTSSVKVTKKERDTSLRRLCELEQKQRSPVFTPLAAPLNKKPKVTLDTPRLPVSVTAITGPATTTVRVVSADVHQPFGTPSQTSSPSQTPSQAEGPLPLCGSTPVNPRGEASADSEEFNRDPVVQLTPITIKDIEDTLSVRESDSDLTLELPSNQGDFSRGHPLDLAGEESELQDTVRYSTPQSEIHSQVTESPESRLSDAQRQPSSVSPSSISTGRTIDPENWEDDLDKDFKERYEKARGYHQRILDTRIQTLKIEAEHERIKVKKELQDQHQEHKNAIDKKHKQNIAVIEVNHYEREKLIEADFQNKRAVLEEEYLRELNFIADNHKQRVAEEKQRCEQERSELKKESEEEIEDFKQVLVKVNKSKRADICRVVGVDFQDNLEAALEGIIDEDTRQRAAAFHSKYWGELNKLDSNLRAEHQRELEELKRSHREQREADFQRAKKETEKELKERVGIEVTKLKEKSQEEIKAEQKRISESKKEYLDKLQLELKDYKEKRKRELGELKAENQEDLERERSNFLEEVCKEEEKTREKIRRVREEHEKLIKKEREQQSATLKEFRDSLDTKTREQFNQLEIDFKNSEKVLNEDHEKRVEELRREQEEQLRAIKEVNSAILRETAEVEKNKLEERQRRLATKFQDDYELAIIEEKNKLAEKVKKAKREYRETEKEKVQKEIQKVREENQRLEQTLKHLWPARPGYRSTDLPHRPTQEDYTHALAHWKVDDESKRYIKETNRWLGARRELRLPEEVIDEYYFPPTSADSPTLAEEQTVTPVSFPPTGITQTQTVVQITHQHTYSPTSRPEEGGQAKPQPSTHKQVTFSEALEYPPTQRYGDQTVDESEPSGIDFQDELDFEENNPESSRINPPGEVFYEIDESESPSDNNQESLVEEETEPGSPEVISPTPPSAAQGAREFRFSFHKSPEHQLEGPPPIASSAVTTANTSQSSTEASPDDSVFTELRTTFDRNRDQLTEEEVARMDQMMQKLEELMEKQEEKNRRQLEQQKTSLNRTMQLTNEQARAGIEEKITQLVGLMNHVQLEQDKGSKGQKETAEVLEKALDQIKTMKGKIDKGDDSLLSGTNLMGKIVIDGKTNIEDSIRKFRDVVDCKSWTPDEQAKNLKYATVGAVRTWLERELHTKNYKEKADAGQITQDFVDDLLKGLEKNFATKSEYMRELGLSSPQTRSEPVATYYTRVISGVKDITAPGAEKTVTGQFVRGLLPEIRAYVMAEKVSLDDLNANYQAAKFAEELEEMRKAQKYEEAKERYKVLGGTVGMIDPPSHMQPFYTDYAGPPVPEVPQVNPAAEDNKNIGIISQCMLEIAKTTKDQAKEIEDLKKAKRKQENFQPNRAPECMYCHNTGHHWRQCKSRMENIQTMAMGPQGQPNQQVVSYQQPAPPQYQQQQQFVPQPQYQQFQQYPPQGQNQQWRNQNWGNNRGPRGDGPYRRRYPNKYPTGNESGNSPRQGDGSDQRQPQANNAPEGGNKYRNQEAN